LRCIRHNRQYVRGSAQLLLEMLRS
jgi:hypothetical protein